jgi:SAM-dependent methyltransferase
LADDRVTTGARELFEAGPHRPVKSEYGSLGQLVRRVVLRAVRPYSGYQRELDAQVVAALEGLDTRRRDQETQIAWLTREIDGLLRAIDGHQRRLDAIEERGAAVPYTAGRDFQLQEVPMVGTVLGFERGGDGSQESYAAFEDIFRGPEEHVRELQRVYLRLLDGRAPVLDVGCGRGEFLDLLEESGVQAIGVDTDAGMLERARAKGHRVQQADGIDYLAGLPDASLGVIFSAQVIEHLPYERLIELLRLAPAKLAPGGLLILETVNPHDPQALKTFWVDPTHQHPLFPEVMLALCRINGFDSAYVFHPQGSGDYSADSPHHSAYAVVATSPGE